MILMIGTSIGFGKKLRIIEWVIQYLAMNLIRKIVSYFKNRNSFFLTFRIFFLLVWGSIKILMIGTSIVFGKSLRITELVIQYLAMYKIGKNIILF